VAIDFLTHHELGHVLYGHVGLLNSRGGTPFIAELDWARPKSLSSLEMQTLEMDADCFAVAQGVFGVLGRVTRRETLNAEWRKHFGTPEDGMRLWLLAVFLLFRLFVTAAMDTRRLGQASHPPPRIRQFIAASAASEAIKKYGSPALRDQLAEALAGTIREAENAYALVTGEPPEFDTIEASMSPEALAHTDLLLKTWKQIRPDLVPFARLPLVE
jgi:hypothetical protein